MAGNELNIKVCSPLKLHSSLIGSYHAICHYSYNLSLAVILTRPDATFFIPKTKGVEIHKKVKPLKEEKVIIKHYPNSFRDTDLLKTLKDENIERLVICGMMTHMCVDATTRASKDFGFDCIVIGDACATKDLEINGEKVKAIEVQKSFLSALNYFYSNVISTEDYLNL